MDVLNLNEKPQKKTSTIARDSNFELLRILAMLMIVIYHICCHCVTIQLTDANSIARMNNGWFSYPYFYKQLLILVSFMKFGNVSNAIFILISGYFLVNKTTVEGKNNINVTKTAKKLLLQLGFATIALMLGSDFLHYIKPEDYLNLSGVQAFNEMSWFAGYYFLVIVIAYLFLNKYLAEFNQKEYMIFLVTIFALLQFSFTRGLIEGFSGYLSILLIGIFLYSLGGYMHKYNPFGCIRVWAILAIVIFMNVFVWLSFYNSTETNIESFMRYTPNGTFMQNIPGFANYSIVIVVIAVSVFEIFRRIRLPHSKLINYLGSATFMVYLIHDNSFFYSLWDMKDWITLLYTSPLMFTLELLKWASYTFLLGVIAYIFFDIITRNIYRLKKWAMV